VSDFSVVATPPSAPAGEESLSRYAALYLSPERAMGRRLVPASDVYTLGVILYEMLTGHPPFEGESFSAVADKHIREKPEQLESINPQVPRSLSVLVHRALAKASRDRYRTGGALEEALETYRRQSGRLELVERIRDQEIEADRVPVGAMRAPPPAVGQNAGLDWVGCLVGMIAFMAVLGLIPLWVTVFLRYFA
jgi:serine/threonine-protein kinase